MGVTLGRLALSAALLAGALLVFGRVRSEYQSRGALSRPTAILQVGFLCAYALSSYAFLDARLSQVNASGPFFVVALALMGLGLLMIVLSMPFLGKRSFGDAYRNYCEQTPRYLGLPKR